ncbi:putative ribonuclease H-like domain-containing protein, partial [Tanacetum coccineum]
LRVYEDEMKRSSSSTPTSQNLAFLSSDNTSTTNEVSTASGDFRDSTAGGTSQVSSTPCAHDIDGDDLEELDLRWQVAMLTVRVKKFIQRTGRNLDFKEKRHVSLDKSKIECYNCHRKGHFARECRSRRNQGRRSYGDNGRSNAPTNESSSQALVAQDGLGGYDWSNDFEVEPVNYALMAISSSSSSSSSDSEVQKCSKQCLESFKTLQKNYDTEREKHNKAKLEIRGYEIALESLESRILRHEKNELAWGEKYEFQNYELKCREIKINNLNLELEKVVKERDDLKDKIAKWEESTKNLEEILNSQMSARDKTGLGYSTQLNELSSNHETDSENSFSVFDGRSSDEDSTPANDRSSQAEGYKAVLPPITGNFLTPRADISFAGLDEYAIRNKIIESQTSKLNNKTSEITGQTNDANTVTPKSAKVSEVKKVRPETQTINTRDDKSGQNSKKQGIGFRKVKACFVCKSTDHLIKDCNFHDKKSQEPKLKNVVNTGQREGKPVWDNTKRVNHQNFSKYPHLSKTFVPSGVLTRTGLHMPSISTTRTSVSTARPVSTASPSISTARPSVSTARPVSTASPSVSTTSPSISIVRPVSTASPSINTARRVSTASPSISTARPVYVTRPIYPRMDNVRPIGSCSLIKRNTAGTRAVVNTSKGKLNTDLKKSRWVWRPKGNYLDHVSKDSGSFMLKKGNLEILLQDHAMVDSGCSSHMTVNKAYLLDYEDFNGGIMSFGSNPKGGKITDKGKIKTANLDFDDVYFVDELNFKLLDESQVVLRAPRKDDVYSLDLKNIVPYRVNVENQVHVDADLEDVANKESEQDLQDELKKMVTLELAAKAMDDVSRQAFEEEKRPSVSTDRPFVSTDRSNTPYVSAVSTPTGANAGESSFVYLGGKIPIDASTLPNADLPIDLNMPDLEDASYTLPNDGIFYGAYDDDKDVGAVADFNNMDNTIVVSPIPILRIHKDHPKGQILGDPTSAVQTRRKFQKDSSAQQALVIYIHKHIKTNHKDHQNYLFACFLSQEEPKTISQALQDESWVEAMQEELLQFKLQKVWVLIDLPYWKKEKGIDYDEVFAHVARAEAVRLFLAFASYMGFTVYQMDVKSAFLYGTIKEEVYVHQPLSFVDPAHPNKSINVKQQLREYLFSQDKYVATSLKKLYFLSNQKQHTTLLSLNQPLVKDEDGVDVDVHVYRSMIGSLMYIDCIKANNMLAVDVNFLEKLDILGNARRHDILENSQLRQNMLQLLTVVGQVLSRESDDDYGKVTPLFDFMLVQQTEDEGEASERPSDSQPIPSPPYPSEDQPQTQPDPSPRLSPIIHIPDSIPRVLVGIMEVTAQANEIKALKAQVRKLKKRVKPLITYHKAWMKTRLARKTSLKKKGVHQEYVSKQRRKFVKSFKGEPSMHKDPAFDDLDDFMDVGDTLDYIETKDDQNKGRTSSVMLEKKESANKEVSTEGPVSTDKQNEGTDKKNDGTDKQDGGTDSTKVSTDRQGEGTADQDEGKSVTQTPTSTPTPTTPTPIVFGDDETIAQVLIIMSQNKEKLKENEKGVEIRNVKETERQRPTSTRSILTLRPLPKIDPKDKGKKRIEEEDKSDTESEGITEAEKKFKQLADDEEVARKARLNADKILAEELQKEEREKFTIEQRAKFLHDTIAAQRKFLAQQRSEAIRNKPPTRNQLRNQMMTYLKHVGGKKHSELKTKTFEEIQVLYERLKRQDQNFVAIGSAEDERQIKEMNEESKDPEKKRLKKRVVNEEDTAKVPAKQEATEQGTKKRKSGHVKMIARKRPRPQPDDDSDDEHRKCLRIITFESTIDSEIMETKSFIARLHKVSSPDGNYLVVYRVNGHFRAFNYLMEVLHIFDRHDLFHLYDLVMKQYSEITPEDIELILWGDLKIMMESSTKEND